MAFGNNTTTRIAQSFQPTVTADICAVKFQLFKTGSPTDALQCELYTNVSGVPDTIIATASNTVSGSGLTATKEIHLWPKE